MAAGSRRRQLPATQLLHLAGEVIAVAQDDDIGLGREGRRRDRQDDRGGEEWPRCQLAVALRPVAA
jgi:hypothetical protein